MKQSKILRYSGSSKLMNVDIEYGEERFRFNLFKEIQINEDIIGKEIANQPSYYGFISVLYAKLIRKFKDAELNCKRIYAELFVQYKNEGGPNEMAEQRARSDEEYVRAIKAMNRAEERMNILQACVKSFEQRKDLIQTLAANQRKSQA